MKMESMSQAPGNIIGKLLLETGKLNPIQADEALQLQRETGIRFGEAAIKLGFVTEQDIQQALSRQFAYPYVVTPDSGISPAIVAAYNPFDPRVESMRGLRSQLMLRWLSTGKKRLLFAGFEQGKALSLTVANLAVMFSQLGERTLVIDTNLRTPHQQDLFGLNNRAGLSDVLAGRAGLEAIQKVEALHDLSVLTSGNPAPNPHELLSRDAFGHLIEQAEQQYDVVLFDSLPLSVALDVQLVAAQARGVVLVGQKHHTPLQGMAALAKQTRMAGAELLGCILTSEA